MEHLKVIQTKRSLSSYVSQCTRVFMGCLFLGLLGILLWSLIQPNAETDLIITTTTKNNQISLSQLTAATTIQGYIDSDSYLNAIASIIGYFIMPFVTLLGLMFIWGKQLYPSTRIKLILFIVLTSKLSLISAFIEAILTYSAYVDVKYDNIEVKTVSNPIPAFGVFVAVNITTTILIDIFFILDQYYCHRHNDNNLKIQLQHTDTDIVNDENNQSKCKMLAFEYKPQSYLGVAILAIFLTILIANTWILLESWYTVAVRFDAKGLLSMILTVPDTIRSYSLIEIPGALYDSTQSGLTISVLVYSYILGTTISSMTLQISLLFVWFIPIYNSKYYVWFIRLLYIAQSLNCFDLYFISLILCGTEIDKFLKYEAANKELPNQCGVNSIIGELFGSCFYVQGYFHFDGLLLVLATALIHWFSLFYTTYAVNKSGIKVILKK